jgi:3-phenylpropionate/trans-cinnamate dioxygenase ferredoxin reductase subunit
MPPVASYVIVGGGLAASRAACALRRSGFDGRLKLIAAEPHLPYDRPPLSKKVLTGEAELQSTLLSDAAAYAAQEIEFFLGVGATAIDRHSRQIRLTNGETLPYDKLLLATGSRAHHLAIPGSELAGIHYLRSLDDCMALKAALKPGLSVAIVGGGYVGLEVAASARQLGCAVTVLESQPVVMSRVVLPEVGRWFERLHRSHDTVVRTHVNIKSIGGQDGRATHIQLSDGEHIAADVVIIGVGSIANMELAVDSGLSVGDGIMVDDQGRTSDPNIFAAGDVTCHQVKSLGRYLRLESWQNAQAQGMAAGGAMCGQDVHYAEIPWFWSDQYDVNLQLIGLPGSWDAIVYRRYPRQNSLSLVYVKDQRVVGANVINAPRDVAILRRLIQRQLPVDVAKLGDAAYPLRQMLAA